MKMQLSHQAAERLGQSDLVIITERVDDVAFLIGQMVKMGLPEVLDHHIPRHWTQRGLSWGWTAVIWLAYIVTEGDHRKVSMETYLKGMHHTLSRLTAQAIEPLDFSDDRLSHLLWLLRCVSSSRIYAGFRIDAREIYSFSMTYQALFANLIKSLAIFTSNGAWFPSNLTKRPTRFEGSHHVPNETIRHQTSQD